MMAGQTINDRLLAARHSIAGQGLAKSVCKATTEEMIAPKKKHLDYLVHCTNEPNVSIPQLANLLVERSQSTNWVVVYKALITVHHLLAYGNERFTQYLASSNSNFQLGNFLDKSGVQGYDMSPFIRRYANYLNNKALSYRTVAFDFCKVKRGKEEGSLRMMNAEKLLKTLPVLQNQLDSLLSFDCTANDLTNGVINMCFMLLFRDLIRLFACYNDGIINLLEKYFDMNKKNCRDALDLYKRFLIRMDKVGEFLKVAENVGIDKGDIPDLTKAPSSLLDALEGHLATLEGKKGSAANTPTQTASAQKNVASVMGALSNTSTAFGTAAASARLDNAPTSAFPIDDAAKLQALADEEAAMSQYKNKVNSPTGTMTNPFLGSAPPTNESIVDLFGPGPASNGGDATSNQGKASDDLLSLGNPFADMFAAPAHQQQPQAWTSAPPSMVATQPGMGMTGTNGFPFGAPQQANQQQNAFIPEANFSNVFNNEQNAMSWMGGQSAAPPQRPAAPKSAFDELEDALRVQLGGSPARKPAQATPMQAMIGQQQQSPQQQQQGGRVLTGDLDSSLASLANNLTINKAQLKGGIQWTGSPASSGKWSPQPIAAVTTPNYRPMGQGMQLPPMFQTYHSAHYTMQQPGVMSMPSLSAASPGSLGMPVVPTRPASHQNNFFS